MQLVGKEELAEVILDLINRDPDIQRAIVDVVCSCPNIVLES
jgi:hypothetical protein